MDAGRCEVDPGRCEVLGVSESPLTKRDPFATDFKLRAQTDDAVDSVCRNTAEGFGCGDREFARFLRIASRSLNEVQDQFRSALLKGYVGESDLVEAKTYASTLSGACFIDPAFG